MEVIKSFILYILFIYLNVSLYLKVKKEVQEDSVCFFGIVVDKMGYKAFCIFFSLIHDGIGTLSGPGQKSKLCAMP